MFAPACMGFGRRWVSGQRLSLAEDSDQCTATTLNTRKRYLAHLCDSSSASLMILAGHLAHSGSERVLHSVTIQGMARDNGRIDLPSLA